MRHVDRKSIFPPLTGTETSYSWTWQPEKKKHPLSPHGDGRSQFRSFAMSITPLTGTETWKNPLAYRIFSPLRGRKLPIRLTKSRLLQKTYLHPSRGRQLFLGETLFLSQRNIHFPSRGRKYPIGVVVHNQVRTPQFPLAGTETFRQSAQSLYKCRTCPPLTGTETVARLAVPC